MHDHDVQEYITSLLDFNSYLAITKSKDGDCLNLQDVYQAVTSSKFRKSKLDEEEQNDIKAKIQYYSQNKAPLQFSVPFGAYKSYKLDLDFMPDWAEVFNVSYLLKYGAQILEVYPFGVDFYYTYTANIMHIVSDIPLAKLQRYANQFETILNMFNSICPAIRFHLVPINSLYESDVDFYSDFLELFLDNLVFWEQKYESEIRERHLGSARRNLYPFGKHNISKMNPEDIERCLFLSALMTDAVDCLSERRKFNKNSDKIQLVGVKGPTKSINIGACETSTVHFWVSRGCLQYNKGKIKPFIYTYSKLAAIEKNRIVECKVKSEFSNISENFHNILFVKE